MPIFIHRLKRNWWLALALLVILAACTPPAAPGCPVIRIGVIFNPGDPTAMAEQKAGYDEAVKDINQAGIGQGCQVEWVAPQTGPEITSADPQRNVQDLTAQGAVAIIAPPADFNARQVASMSRYFAIPVLIPAESGDDIIESGKNSWNFTINPTSRDYASAAFELVRTSPTSFIPNAAIFFEHTEYGESAAVAAGDAALRNNVAIAVYQRFSPFLEDFKDIQAAILSKHPNVIYLISTQPKQADAIIRAIRGAKDAAGNAPSLNFFFASGSAFSDPDLLYSTTGKLNPDLNNLILSLPWTGNSSRLGGKTCPQVLPADKSGEEPGRLVLNTVQAYVSLRMIADAVQQLTRDQIWTVNDKKISDWMAMFTSSENQAVFRTSLASKIRSFLGCQFGNYLWPVEFNSDGRNVLTPVLVKVSGGNLVQVFPQK